MKNTVEHPDIDEILDTQIKDLLDNNKSIILFNDTVNNFDYVIDCLIVYCNHSSIQAEQCALIAHNQGLCNVKSGSIKELTKIYNALKEKKLSVEIQ
jgi:ATP-dependent Clp protease adaptor protein ClpS